MAGGEVRREREFAAVRAALELAEEAERGEDVVGDAPDLEDAVGADGDAIALALAARGIDGDAVAARGRAAVFAGAARVGGRAARFCGIERVGTRHATSVAPLRRAVCEEARRFVAAAAGARGRNRG